METYNKENRYYDAISIKDSSKPTDVYFCNWCYRKLFYREQDKETGKHIWLCTNCNIEFIPDNQLTKQKSTLKTPGPIVDNSGNVIEDNAPLIAVVDDPNKELLSSTTYKQQKLSPSFEALKRSGFKFTSYEER